MRKLLYKGIALIFTLFIVMVLLGVILGATGFSDRSLRAIVNEELRGLRTSLAQSIRDPEELEKVLAVRQNELEEFHGIDRPWYVRLPKNTAKVISLDLGKAKTLRSTDGSSKVSDIVLERLPNTMLLMLTSFFAVAFIGISVGAWLATRAGSKIDMALSMFAASSFAVPVWWFGILLVFTFAVKLQVLPGGGMYTTPPPEGTLSTLFDLLKHAVLPVLALALVSIGPYLYLIRTMTLSVAQEDFVLYARACGFRESRIRWRHILRVAAPPILTGLILGLAGSFAGAILTETVFNWPGMGRLYYEAVLGTPDEGLIVALTFIYTLLYLIARFVLEVLYILLDPRVRS